MPNKCFSAASVCMNLTKLIDLNNFSISILQPNDKDELCKKWNMNHISFFEDNLRHNLKGILKKN